MTAIAHPQYARPTKTRWLLLALELFIAVTAVGGAIYGLSGAESVPREWLEGSPFDGYLIPSLTLLVAVAGSMAVAAGGILLWDRRAPGLSVAAGVVLLGWLAGQLLIIPFSWLQPLYAALALAVIGLGRRLHRQPAPQSSGREFAVQVVQRGRPAWLWLSVPIALLAVTGSVAGILVDSIYSKETENWAAQSVAQDIANLAAFPALLLLAAMAGRGSLRAYLAWLGVLAFSVYSYAIYAFTIHFGPLFLPHVAVLGLSVYALIGGIVSLDVERVKASFGERAPVRSTAALLLALGSGSSLLWLSGIVPATLAGETPDELLDTGLPANPVHVIDLAVLLPAALLAGALLRSRRSFGFVLAPLVLTAMALLGVTIVTIQAAFAARDLDAVWGVAAGVGVVTVVELLVLARFLRAIERDDLPAVRASEARR